MKVFRTQYGITIIELLVVVIIIGIIAAFGIPNFSRSRDRAEEKSAAKQMAMAKNAMRTYFSRENVTRIPNTGVSPDYNVSRINELLRINVVEPPNMTLQCWDDDGTNTNYCRMLHADGWAVGFHDTAAGVIIGEPVHCVAGMCMSCDANGCPY